MRFFNRTLPKLFFPFIPVILVLFLLHPRATNADNNNLIQNPSFETPDTTNPNSPQHWQTDNWGTNQATFTYPDTGAQDGTRSARIDIVSYTNGDAKWAAAPVTVSPSTQYTFSDYYKSSVSTTLFGRVIDSQGNTSYFDIGTAPAAANWTQLSFTFTTPANAAQLTVLHVIAAVGYLQTDNYSLVALASTPTPTPIPGNIVPNASVETPSTTNQNNPDQWQPDSWGTNTPVFTYLTTGHSGSRSVKVQLTSYTDGDAKWFFTPQSVTAGARYTVGDYYESDVTTHVFVAFTMNDGTKQYVQLSDAPAAASWDSYSDSVLVPQNATSMSIYHVISQVGFLITDDYSAVVTSAQEDLISNASVETVSPDNVNLPDHWQTNSWGTNQASFTYLHTGHTGSRSVEVQITSYTDGDAKWAFTPLSLTPGSEYKYTDFYQSNVTSRVVMYFTYADGSTSADDLRNAPPSDTWTQYTDSFTVPANAQSVVIYHLISSVGYLITDDFSLTPYTPVGFSRPLVTLTFDNGFEDNITTALPIMEQHGFISTQYISPWYLTVDKQNDPDTDYDGEIEQFFAAGHEIASHTWDHSNLTELSQSDVDSQLSESQQYLENLVGAGNVTNFAVPFGAYNTQVIDSIKNYYRSNRTTDPGFNSKDNFDQYELKDQNMLNTTTLAEFQSWLDEAKRDNTWLIITYHRVASDPGQYDTPAADFAPQMQALQNSGIAVVTIDQALNEVIPQLTQ